MAKQALRQGEKVLFGIFGAFIVAAVIGYIALETIRLTSDKPLFEVKTHFALSEDGLKGSAIFRKSRCTACHRAMRNGTNMGLSLDGVGTKRDYEWILEFMHNPEATYGSETLDHGPAPKEAAYVSRMSDEDLRQIAVFLSELRADQGSSSSPIPPKGKSEFIDGMLKAVAPPDWKEKYSDIRDRDDQAVDVE
ncbi:c-type cytochrome [Pseudomonadota bacterium]